jgi:hypothetical protein
VTVPTTRKYWNDAELQKLRSLAGKRTLNEIAQELGHPRGSVATKAYQLKISLRYLRRRQSPELEHQ